MASFKKLAGNLDKFFLAHSWLEGLLLCLPITVFMLPMLLTGNKITPGDPDYIFHLAEAGRQSILVYHQFPWWDPWISGGIPLFGSIVYGLVSVQTPFTLVFGAVFGWKLAIVAYQIIGFFGFRKMFREVFETERLRATLLAYIPMLGSGFIYRAVDGHSPFLLLAFVPWLITFFFRRSEKRSWLWFALVLSFIIWTSPHYVTIMGCFAIGLWYIYELIDKLWCRWRYNSKFSLVDLKTDAMFFVKAGALTIVLSAYRMLFVYTFIKDFPRPEPLNADPYTGILRGFEAIWGFGPYTHRQTLSNHWGWEEASTYIGAGTLVALALILCAVFFNRRQKKKTSFFSYSPYVLIALFVTFFSLGMGHFGSASPYALLHNFPVFSSMRVATRWLLWSSLVVLFLIAAYRGRRFSGLINLCLLAVIIEFFLITLGPLSRSFSTPIEHYRSNTSQFDQVYHYRIPRPQFANNKNYQESYFYDENVLETTENNYGQVIFGDPLVDTRQFGTTIRCGINEGSCHFISPNAKISYWSPNKIVLTRTAPGWIQLNMNTGRGWLVNGEYAFIGDKVTDPLQAFIIKDANSKTITLQYRPKYSLEWWWHKL
jgi:hypothetical protein